jgi:hypothetical protein
MSNDDDARPEADRAERPPKEPPYQALFPNLDRVSRSSFDPGTVSRRRINRALAVLGLIVVTAVVAAIVLPLVLR